MPNNIMGTSFIYIMIYLLMSRVFVSNKIFKVIFAISLFAVANPVISNGQSTFVNSGTFNIQTVIKEIFVDTDRSDISHIYLTDLKVNKALKTYDNRLCFQLTYDVYLNNGENIHMSGFWTDGKAPDELLTYNKEGITIISLCSWNTKAEVNAFEKKWELLPACYVLHKGSKISNYLESHNKHRYILDEDVIRSNQLKEKYLSITGSRKASKSIRKKSSNKSLSKDAIAVVDKLKSLAYHNKSIYSVAHAWNETGAQYREKSNDHYVPKKLDDIKLSSWFTDNCGKTPLIHYMDLSTACGSYYSEDYEKWRASMVAVIKKAYYQYHAIPLFTWHLENPYVPSGWRDLKYGESPYRYRFGSSGYPQEHTNVVSEILNSTGSLCGLGSSSSGNNKSYRNPREWYDAMLQEVSTFLAQLVDENGRNIPVIIRPFHECDGDWFWWGSKYTTPTDYKSLFQYTVRRLNELTRSNSVLFAYSPDRTWDNIGKNDAKDYLLRYPGDDYVDIIGFDDYSIGESEHALKETIRKARLVSNEAIKRDKLAALFETGASGKKDDMYTKYLYSVISDENVSFSIICTWGESETIPGSKEGKNNWKCFLQLPEIILWSEDNVVF